MTQAQNAVYRCLALQKKVNGNLIERTKLQDSLITVYGVYIGSHLFSKLVRSKDAAIWFKGLDEQNEKLFLTHSAFAS